MTPNRPNTRRNFERVALGLAGNMYMDRVESKKKNIAVLEKSVIIHSDNRHNSSGCTMVNPKIKYASAVAHQRNQNRG